MQQQAETYRYMQSVHQLTHSSVSEVFKLLDGDFLQHLRVRGHKEWSAAKVEPVQWGSGVGEMGGER